jgi:hypothetical protein
VPTAHAASALRNSARITRITSENYGSDPQLFIPIWSILSDLRVRDTAHGARVSLPMVPLNVASTASPSRFVDNGQDLEHIEVGSNWDNSRAAG